jgi:small-conductance mechanosensitive channel
MSEYKPGEMNITEQERTYSGFVKMTINVCILVIAVLIFLAVFVA